MPKKPDDDHHGADFVLILITIVLLFAFWQGALVLIRLVSRAVQ
jgi:hypothetical protein